MGTRRGGGHLALLLWLASSGCGERVQRVQLELVQGVPGPLRCVDTQGAPLLLRARDTGLASVVVDLLRLPTSQFCSASELVRTCAAGDCEVLPEMRRCVPLGVYPELEQGEALEAIDAELKREAEVLIERAPGGPVVVRAVLRASDCAGLPEVEAPFEKNTLLGCGVSCPVDLGQHTGALPLDLPVLGTECSLSEVDVCANVTAR